MNDLVDKDLFGNAIIKDPLLRDKFIEPPFSVLDTKSGSWQSRKRKWLNLGIKSEVGRSVTGQVALNDNNKFLDKNGIPYKTEMNNRVLSMANNASIFDPALCELIYNWFCPVDGIILDPFAGGSVRGIVANYLGFTYYGIELREEQIKSNIEQSLNILPKGNQPIYYCGDSENRLDDLNKKFDFVFSCPPYGNLEKYSDLSEDLSNMTYDNFLIKYKSIIKKSCNLLKENSFACFVVGDFRDKKGNYYGFVADTIKIFQSIGMNLWNEGILLTAIGTAAFRANLSMRNKKLVKLHQNVLIFKKC